jgi:hypothetical protein
MDEQWQYVGCHSGRMIEKEKRVATFRSERALTPETEFSRIASASAVGLTATFLSGTCAALS